jgi:hypothetical protein
MDLGYKPGNQFPGSWRNGGKRENLGSDFFSRALSNGAEEKYFRAWVRQRFNFYLRINFETR